MDDLYPRFLDLLDREKAMILRAWKSLSVIVLIVGAAVWWATSSYYAALYEETLRVAEQRREYAQDQVEELRSQQGTGNQRKRQAYTIRNEDEVDFVQTLRSVEHDMKIEIASAAGDVKATALARRMSALFELCSWSVTEWSAATPKDQSPGVTIWASKKYGSLPAAAGVLKALLTKYNIEARTQWLSPEEDIGHPFGSLRIFVGSDPQDLSAK